MAAQHDDEPADAVLVVAAILGDLRAFDILVLRYRAAVQRLAQSIIGRQEAADVAQDAWLRAFRALPSIEDPTRFGPWLMAITRNRALRYHERRRARQHRQVDFDDILRERLAHLPAISPAQHDDAEMLDRALDQLPDDYALPLRLFYLDDLPQRRVADFLGVPVSTVKWRVHRGKQMLRDLLHRDVL